MFIVLLDTLNGPIELNPPIDNSEGNKLVGLREITYTAGWYNISKELDNNTYIIRNSLNEEEFVTIRDGYYNLELLEKFINRKVKGFKLDYDFATGLITMVLPAGNIYNFLNLADIFGGESKFYSAGTIFLKKSPQFYTNKAILVNLAPINTNSNE